MPPRTKGLSKRNLKHSSLLFYDNLYYLKNQLNIFENCLRRFVVVIVEGDEEF